MQKNSAFLFPNGSFRCIYRDMLTSNARPNRQARMRYYDAHVKTITEGDYVTCAATDKKIPVDMLRYWSVDLQEPYFDAAASELRRSQIKVDA